jgi:TRAP-type C4-dicarboxylate transport system permease small subunit
MATEPGRMMTTYAKIVNSVTRVFGFLGAVTMIGLVVMTVVDVFLRYFFRAPILGSFELTELFLVVMVFFGIPWAAIRKANVRVDLFVGRLPPRTLATFDSVTCFLSLVIIAFCAWYTVPQIIYIWRLHSVTDMLEVPIYPFYIAVAVGFFLLFFILVANFIEFVKKAVNPVRKSSTSDGKAHTG